jgi:hypothetical protein
MSVPLKAEKTDGGLLMLDAKQIKSIHIAKSAAGLSDEQYRKLLFEVTGAKSSKDSALGDREYNLFMKAMKKHKYPGWQPGQVKKFRQYSINFCAMTEDRARGELFKLTGKMHETSPDLDNEDFEIVMSEFESKLESLIKGCMLGKPAGVDINYWRNRFPRDGRLTTRQDWEIRSLWADLKIYFDEDKREFNYLHGFISKVLGLRLAITDLFQLKSWQAVKAIDALKSRLDQEVKKLQKDVPF